MKNNNYRNIVIEMYQNFNNRDIEAVLSLMNKDVIWPNGWEGGYVRGHSDIRDFCTRQWKTINHFFEPIAMKARGKEKFEVMVHHLVKDLKGKLLSDGIVKHIYKFQNGFIKSMEIEQI